MILSFLLLKRKKQETVFLGETPTIFPPLQQGSPLRGNGSVGYAARLEKLGGGEVGRCEGRRNCGLDVFYERRL